jgi:hypothetical protein
MKGVSIQRKTAAAARERAAVFNKTAALKRIHTLAQAAPERIIFSTRRVHLWCKSQQWRGAPIGQVYVFGAHSLDLHSSRAQFCFDAISDTLFGANCSRRKRPVPIYFRHFNTLQFIIRLCVQVWALLSELSLQLIWLRLSGYWKLQHAHTFALFLWFAFGTVNKKNQNAYTIKFCEMQESW